MSRSGEQDIDAMTNAWGDEENEEIERAMAEEQALAAPRGWTRFVAHDCPKTQTFVGTLVDGSRCQFCGELIKAPQVTYNVHRAKLSGDVFCTVHRVDDPLFKRANYLTDYPLAGVFIHGGAFNYGYAGSGPADLALSIAADFFGERPKLDVLRTGAPQCMKFHQALKFRFLVAQDADHFSLSSLELERWLDSITTPPTDTTVDAQA